MRELDSALGTDWGGVAQVVVKVVAVVLNDAIGVIDYRPTRFGCVAPAQGAGCVAIGVSVDVDDRTSFDF